MIPSLEAVERRLVKKGGLYRFIQLAWRHVLGDEVPFVGGRHLQEICKHLEAVARGDCKRLLIMVPPGCTKSSATSVFFPAWQWIEDGSHAFMTISFDLQISLRDADKARDLVTSDWYQSRWGARADQDDLARLGLKPVTLEQEEGRKGRSKANAKGYYVNTQRGSRFSTQIGGKGTGWHAATQIIDDPVKPSLVQEGGEKARFALDRACKTLSGTFATRARNLADFRRVLIMQRLHMDDPAGMFEATGDWTVLRLPMRYDPANHCTTPYGGDWRTEEGELLEPIRFPESAIKALELDLGPRDAAAQLQQDPSPDGGVEFDRSWFSKRWTVLPAGGQWVQSWDLRFKEASSSGDWVVGQVWYKAGGCYYLVDQIRARLSFTATCAAIKDLSAKWPRAIRKIVENKANGPAVVNQLEKEVSGLVLVEPEGGKVARARATTGVWAAGNVYLPEGAPWAADFVEEHCRFPLGSADDQVDATSQAITNFEAKGSAADKRRKAYERKKRA